MGRGVGGSVFTDGVNKVMVGRGICGVVGSVGQGVVETLCEGISVLR